MSIVTDIMQMLQSDGTPETFTPSAVHTLAFDSGIRPENGKVTTRKALNKLCKDGKIRLIQEAQMVAGRQGEPVYGLVE